MSSSLNPFCTASISIRKLINIFKTFVKCFQWKTVGFFLLYWFRFKKEAEEDSEERQNINKHRYNIKKFKVYMIMLLFQLKFHGCLPT